MGVLTKFQIIEYLDKNELIINPSKNKDGQFDVQPASYDLRAGTLIWKEFNPDTKQFHTETKEYDPSLPIDQQDTLCLQPGQVVFVITYEEIKMPDDLCGTVYAKNCFSRDGILAFTTGHIDPGVQCPIVIRLINLRAIPFTLQLGQEVYTVVFHKLDYTDKNNLAKHPHITREKTRTNTLASADSALGNALNDLSMTSTFVKKDEFNKLFRGAIGKYAWVIIIALALLVTLTANFIKIWEHFNPVKHA